MQVLTAPSVTWEKADGSIGGLRQWERHGQLGEQHGELSLCCLPCSGHSGGTGSLVLLPRAGPPQSGAVCAA